MREKILKLMKSENLTSSKLAEMLEIQPSGISHILAGRNKPGFELLKKILVKFPRVNPDWLILDNDVMYRDQNDASTFVTSNEEARPADGLFAVGEDSASAAASDNNPIAPNLSSQISSNRNVPISRIIIVYADSTFESLTSK